MNNLNVAKLTKFCNNQPCVAIINVKCVNFATRTWSFQESQATSRINRISCQTNVISLIRTTFRCIIYLFGSFGQFVPKLVVWGIGRLVVWGICSHTPKCRAKGSPPIGLIFIHISCSFNSLDVIDESTLKSRPNQSL